MSDDKRSAIPAAASLAFAEPGHWATPTAAISRAAGVAEGTLFTYFRIKDELLDALYRELRLELAEALLARYPGDADIRSKLEHLWTRYGQWGISNPGKSLVMSQLKLSGAITSEAHAVGMESFVEVELVVKHSMRRQTVRKIPADLIAAVFAAMAAVTMAGLSPRRSGHAAYRRQGFDMFWNAIAQKEAV